jgi:hypothetical protein
MLVEAQFEVRRDGRQEVRRKRRNDGDAVALARQPLTGLCAQEPLVAA